MATGFAPFLQYRQTFSPAFSPVQLSGWNGPGTFSPVCGPDRSSAANTLPANRMVTHRAAMGERLLMGFISFIWGTRESADHAVAGHTIAKSAPVLVQGEIV